MEGFLANALNGLSWGMLLFLISVGLTTIFGVMGVLNFAHGSLFMLGAYLCMQFVRWVGSFWIGLLLGPPIVAGLSILLERFLLRPLYSRDVSFQLLLTFGVMLFLDDGVRLIWGAAYHVVNPPQILSGVIPLSRRVIRSTACFSSFSARWSALPSGPSSRSPAGARSCVRPPWTGRWPRSWVCGCR